MINVDIKILREAIANRLPHYATCGSAAMDVQACIEAPMILEPQSSALIPSGFAFHIKSPEYAALLLPRSGLGHKHGIVLGNLVGLIDADYQGEVMVSLWNRSHQSYTITPFERIAQLMFVPLARAQWNIVDEFVQTERGSGGFGSTGR